MLHTKLTKSIVPVSSLTNETIKNSNVMMDDNWEECVVVANKDDKKQNKPEMEIRTVVKKADCAKKHGLTKCQTRKSNEYLCDDCEKGIDALAFIYSCRICDYDLCKKCFKKKSKSLVISICFLVI